MFQSLFYWILFFYNGYKIYFPCWVAWVSILILLDSLLLYLVDFVDTDYIPNISILILLDSLLLLEVMPNTQGHLEVFQSLFYWILFFYKEVIPKHTEIDYLFQSLFYWILFSYKVSKTYKNGAPVVSILILLDSLLL